MKAEWLAFLSAIQFLTRLPVPDPGWEDGRLDRAAKWFPLVGVIVGIVSSLAMYAAALAGQPFSVTLIIALLAATLASGALHEDGLADTADGIGGGRDRAHRLAIMKDSSIGTYGALALLFAFALRLAFYGHLASQSVQALVVLLITAHCISRAGMVGIVWSLDYARDSDSAKVAPLTAPADTPGLATVAVTLLAALGLMATAQGGAAPLAGLIFAFISIIALRALYRRKLGGWTGDTAGAAQVVSEITFLAGVAAWISS